MALILGLRRMALLAPVLVAGLPQAGSFVPGAVCPSEDNRVCDDIACGTHTGNSSSLAGAHLRVLAYDVIPYGWPVNGTGESCPPDTAFCLEANRTWQGFDFALLDALREELGFTYEVVGSFVGCNGFPVSRNAQSTRSRLSYHKRCRHPAASLQLH